MTTASLPKPALYDQLGGEPAVDAAVELFYSRMLADDRVAHFFTQTDMKAQKAKQKSFLTMAFGGPRRYTGRRMDQAHAESRALGMTDQHVDIVMGHLGETLAELGVPQALIEQVKAVAESQRDAVMGRAS